MAQALPALAAINLEFRKPAQSVCVGDPVRIGLYAVSSDASTPVLAAIDLVFSWDPAYLDLQGVDGTGATTLFGSFFPPSDPFGLNEVVPPQDGDGLYIAYAPLGTPVPATPAGTLITTFVFTAIANTPGPSFVTIEPTGGTPLIATNVWSGVEPGTPVTGTLDFARVGVGFQICPGDIDDDLDIELTDLSLMLSVFGSIGSHPADLDCDDDVDLTDLSMLLSYFGGSCP
ncbi:MAG: hypothetical protein ACKVS9_06060 [Phycisphaerae bacterium]